MDSRLSTPVKSFLPAAVLLMLAGWAGLFWVVFNTSPTGGTRWLLFFAGTLALTGTVMPAIAFLNRRFPSNPPAPAAAIVRQSLWISVYACTLAWLQIGRVLTPSLALLLIVGLALIEWLIRLRERSLWKV